MALPSILPQEPGIGEKFGTGLGQGLGGLLEGLAGHKLNQLVQRQQQIQTAKAFQQLPGVTPEIAQFLSALSPEERKYPLQNLDSLIKLGQTLGKKGSQKPGVSGIEAIKELGESKPNPEAIQNQTNLVSDIFTSPQEKRERHKLALKEKQLASQEKLSALKETKQYIDTLKNQEKAAKESDLRLNRMIRLVERGKLPNAGLWSFLTKVEETGPLAGGAAGLALGHLFPGIGHAVGGIAGALSSPLAGAAKSLIKTGSPDIEEFEKLSADFVKNAKQFFGSRITDADLRVFMQTLPTLMQTDAGKKKVIENLKSLNELAEIEAKAARDIIRENGGVPPIDIEQQVKDRISDKADMVAKRFIGQ